MLDLRSLGFGERDPGTSVLACNKELGDVSVLAKRKRIRSQRLRGLGRASIQELMELSFKRDS